MKTPHDRIDAIERAVNTLTIKALALKLELSKADWKEEDHPRADDGKFGSGSSSRKKTEFSPASHEMAKKILSRTEKERSADIKTLEKQPKKTLESRRSAIQDQLDDAHEQQKKDPDNPKWHDIREALSRMYSDINFALQG